MKQRWVRPLVEVLSILILFYTNLLMGQYMQSSSHVGKSFWTIAAGVVSAQNFAIGLVGAAAAFLLVEFVNRRA
jgi:hypothetical protein